MIVCNNFFVKANIPKFLEATIEKLQKAEDACFMDKDSFDVFVLGIRQQLEKDKPVGSDVEIYVTPVREGGMNHTKIGIYRLGDYSTDIATASFHECKTVYRWVYEKRQFINIYYRLED